MLFTTGGVIYCWFIFYMIWTAMGLSFPRRLRLTLSFRLIFETAAWLFLQCSRKIELLSVRPILFLKYIVRFWIATSSLSQLVDLGCGHVELEEFLIGKDHEQSGDGSGYASSWSVALDWNLGEWHLGCHIEVRVDPWVRFWVFLSRASNHTVSKTALTSDLYSTSI